MISFCSNLHAKHIIIILRVVIKLHKQNVPTSIQLSWVELTDQKVPTTKKKEQHQPEMFEYMKWELERSIWRYEEVGSIKYSRNYRVPKQNKKQRQGQKFKDMGLDLRPTCTDNQDLVFINSPKLCCHSTGHSSRSIGPHPPLPFSKFFFWKLEKVENFFHFNFARKNSGAFLLFSR